VEEEEVWRMSQGGSAQASAYSLIYHSVPALESRSQSGAASGASFDSLIPSSLRKEVEEDNRALEEELKAWDRKETVQKVCGQLESQFTDLSAEYTSASTGNTPTASPNYFTLEYFLLRLKEPVLVRHVLASRLAPALGGMGQNQGPDNQLMTLLNQQSSNAFELDPVALQRFKELERWQRIWLQAHHHYLTSCWP
jgi:hypothetical protein